MKNIIIKEIEPLEVKSLHDSGEIILIDVREMLEYNEEHLAKAHLFPLSHFKAELLPDPAGKRLLFYCQSGRRSAIAAKNWGEHTGDCEVFCLKGGIMSWKELGLPTVTDSLISGKIERQTYILSGLLILLGLALAQYFSHWFLLIPALIGLLLVISGVLGHSLYSFLLSMLPWNR